MQWPLVRNSQKIQLVYCYDDFSRTLWITKKLRKPIQAMQTVVEKMLNKTYGDDDLRYFVHSSHDTQVWNVLEFL